MGVRVTHLHLVFHKRDICEQCRSGSRGYKKFKLNSAEHESFTAHKCKNANTLNIYKQEKHHRRIHLSLKIAQFLDIVCPYEHLKVHA